MFKGVGTIMPVWQIRRVDPGFIYIIEDHGSIRLEGHAHESPLQGYEDMDSRHEPHLFQPFWGISHHERLLNIGFTNYFYTGEWYDFTGDDDARDVLLDGFAAFRDDNLDMNSRDFIYWYNGEGMAEFAILRLEKMDDDIRKAIPDRR